MECAAFLPGHWFDLSKPPARLYGELIEQAELAEALGFDAVWLAEHHFNNYVAQPGPLQIAAIVASRTRRVRIGIAVVVAPLHHPLRLAGELAQLDVLANGRLEVAVGRGAFPWEAEQMGVHQSEQESRDFCKEHLLVMATALRSRMEAVDHKGSRWTFSNVTIIPPTATPASPRFWMAAQQPASVPWAVASCLDAGLPPAIFCSLLRRPFALVEEMRAALTRSLVERAFSGPGLLAINQVVHLAPSTDQARREAAAALYPLNRAVQNLLPKSGVDGPVLRNGIASDIPLAQEPSEDDLLANAIIGDPDTAIEQVRRYANCGVGHLSLHFNIGQPHEFVVRSMRLFAEVVRPALGGGATGIAAQVAR